MKRAKFVELWSDALEKGSASVFIGAGLSRPAGYPDWRTLLKDIAETLGLDIDNEHDLAAVAQYSINRAAGKRHDLSRLIAKSFPPRDEVPEPFRVLARLPLQHVWTTNYDTLPETAWRHERKLMDVKSGNTDLGIDKPWAHTILYKMHGTADHPNDVVIATDDYELYRASRPGFVQILGGHLVSKQFLFLGFSFTDANIAHLFGNIRENFREAGPEHYAIVRKPQLTGKSASAKARFKTDVIRHELWVEDLGRYGIRCVEIDEFKEIQAILREVEARLARRSVLVSGSYPEHWDGEDVARRLKIEALSRSLGDLISKRGKRLVSGFGLTVGSATMSGALSQILKEPTPNLDKSLLLRPFPQETPDGHDATAFKARYRDGLVGQAGIMIVVGGQKRDPATGALITADGVMEEYQVAKSVNRPVIPVGATGGAAAEIWETERTTFNDTWPKALKGDFERLSDETASVNDLVVAVGRLLDHLDR